jgi:DNA-binding transcriptional ArsR family regulator
MDDGQDILKALANPRKAAILRALACRPMKMYELIVMTGLPQKAVYNHLCRLEKLRMVVRDDQLGEPLFSVVHGAELNAIFEKIDALAVKRRRQAKRAPTKPGRSDAAAQAARRDFELRHGQGGEPVRSHPRPKSV